MNKWLKITLISLLTLVVLLGVGAAGYRLGLTQNPEVIQKLADLRAQRYAQWQQAAPQQQQQQNGATQQGQDALPQQPQRLDGKINPHGQIDPRGDFNRNYDPRAQFDRRDGGRDRSFGVPFFGLLQWIILGAAIWFGYKYVKNSGWKLVREVPQPAPPVAAPAAAEEEPKDAE